MIPAQVIPMTSFFSIECIHFIRILVLQKPSYKWLQNDAWLNLVELSKLYQFSDILQSVNNFKRISLVDCLLFI